jgi:hypothetical protein
VIGCLDFVIDPPQKFPYFISWLLFVFCFRDSMIPLNGDLLLTKEIKMARPAQNQRNFWEPIVRAVGRELGNFVVQVERVEAASGDLKRLVCRLNTGAPAFAFVVASPDDVSARNFRKAAGLQHRYC